MPARKKASPKSKSAAAKKKPAAKRGAKPKTAAPRTKRAALAKPAKASRPKAKARAKAKPKITVKAKAKVKARKPTAAAAKRKTAARSQPRPSTRRDATGHLDPRYAAELLAKGREMHGSDGVQAAFLDKPRSTDELSEELGEEAVAEMTSGEDQRENLLDRERSAEVGGPFVETDGADEYASGTDESNPGSATREPFPTT